MQNRHPMNDISDFLTQNPANLVAMQMYRMKEAALDTLLKDNPNADAVADLVTAHAIADWISTISLHSPPCEHIINSLKLVTEQYRLVAEAQQALREANTSGVAGYIGLGMILLSRDTARDLQNGWAPDDVLKGRDFSGAPFWLIATREDGSETATPITSTQDLLAHLQQSNPSEQ